MLALFRALVERVKALFLTNTALDLEADFVAQHAERQAELLRQAERYTAEGLHGIAEQLRRQAEALDLQRPLAGVLPAVEHLQSTPPHQETAQPRLRLVGAEAPAAAPVSLPYPKKRGGKS